MGKKLFFGAMAFFMLLPLVVPVQVGADSAVCGMDNKIYANAAAAEAAGVDVSYDFACVSATSEQGLYEATSDINFAGQLVEIGSTEVPTTIIVRPNAGGLDVTVNVTADTVLGQRRDQYTQLSDWIPGDQIRVIGKKNGNTDVVDASVLVNASIKVNTHLAANGWITKIDKESKIITYQWANKEHSFAYDDSTRFAAAGKNPASVDDLAVNDRIRGRLLFRAGATPLAKIVVVLRRGPELYMKIRTFRPNAALVRLDSTVVPTTIQVKIEDTPGLKANDVNNLIGSAGALVTVNITADTKIVRKYFGQTDLSEFAVGDKLHIVGRVNDDGTIDAKLLKNNSVWRASTDGFPGVVTEVNVGGNYLMMDWTPVKYALRARIKERLDNASTGVTAQMYKEKLLAAKSASTNAETVGQFKREVRLKNVVINRIKNSLKLADAIERLPAKKIKVTVGSGTKIVVGTNTNATLSDIKNSDKVRARGVYNATAHSVAADTIVVVNSLPEVEEPLTTTLDEINSTVSEIVTDDTSGALVSDTTTATEEVIGESTDDAGSDTTGDSGTGTSDSSGSSGTGSGNSGDTGNGNEPPLQE